MASSTYPSSLFNLSSSSSTSATRLPLRFSGSSFNGCNGVSVTKAWFSSGSRICAKFEKFQAEDELEETNTTPSLPEVEGDGVQEEDDSCLPSDLEGAVRQSGEASASFVSSGGMRAIVELLIPQLQFLDEEGAQAELWELSRVFLDTLIEETGCELYEFICKRVKAVFPDAGAAALLKYRWTDAAFGFASLSDRKPITSEDEIVVMIVPDYQMLEYVERLASSLLDDPPRPLIMWNPRLISEDVGVGFNVRKLRRYFLSTFTTVYSMRPMESGAVFRCYPGSWKVFFDDKERPNRYLLAKELLRRPDAEDLEMIFGNMQEDSEQGPSLFDRAAGMFSSMNRFMRIISK
ncbi:hypothetical protein ACLB2K_057279 [Fragaria x ananassa]